MKKHLGKIIACVAIVLGVIAALMIFAPALVPKSGNGDAMKGSDIAFGAKVGDANYYGASAYILAFLLPLIGVILAVVALLGKGGIIVPVLAAVCFIAGGIVYFLPLQTISYSKDLLDLGAKNEDLRKLTKEFAKIGAGAIVGGLFSILAACASCATLFVKKAK